MAQTRQSHQADFTFVTSAFPRETFRVLHFSGEEAISQPFVFELVLVSDDHELDLEALIEDTAVLTLRSLSGERAIQGVIEVAQHLMTGRHYSHYRVRLVPVHALLRHTRELRIFQSKTTRDIIDAVIKDAGLEADRLSWRLTGKYQPRDYCVQYRESDLDFIQRLLEEEGIFYYFDHSRGQEVMVLADNAATYRPLPVTPALNLRDESTATSLQEEAVLSLQAAAAVASGKATLRDYRFKHPTLDLTAEKSAARFQQLETYDFPGEYQDSGLGKRLAGVRLEEMQGQRTTFAGRATARLLQAGFVFSLALHPREECNTKHLITRLQHKGSERQALLEEAGADQLDDRTYEASFHTIPANQNFRPPRRTSRPLIHGIQSATVVGPKDQEIYVDSFGRVKVQFHWDREGKQDEKSSCWVRVSHPWAGQGFGMISHPRIGQEVLVQFLEGDPDRPLIVGRVYNSDNPVPYSLPDHKTRSTWQSRSTPNGTGSNELRFEDLKDKEEVYLHAEKDFNEVIEHDHTTLVKRDESDTVWRNQSIAVGHSKDQCSDACKFCGGVGNQTISVGMNRSESVGNDESVAVKGKRGHTITKDDSLSVDGNRTVTIQGNFTETVTQGNRSTTIDQGNRTVDVTTGTNTWTVKGAYTGTAKDTYSLTVTNDATITVTSGALKIIAQGSSILIDADTTVTVKGKNIKVQAEEKVELKGGKEVNLNVGQTSISLTAQGITSSGPKINSSAVGIHEISGALIKIN